MKEQNTAGMSTQQPEPIILKDGTLATGGAAIETLSGPVNTRYMDALAFMEEEVRVTVSETSDENAENPVTVGCNGVFKQFFRGVPTTCKRKFVDCLIVKSGRVSTPEFINNAGERAHRIQQTSAHKYPFTMQDRNPRGQEWLEARMFEQI